MKESIISELGNTVGDMLNTHSFIYHYIQYAFPETELVYTDYYSKLFDIYIASVGDCYGGEEVDEMISQIVISAPENLSKTKRISFVKEKMKNLFPGKRPYWVQSPEWPVYNGKPMLFIERKKYGELYRYIFEDVITKEQRIVEQFM